MAIDLQGLLKTIGQGLNEGGQDQGGVPRSPFANFGMQGNPMENFGAQANSMTEFDNAFANMGAGQEVQQQTNNPGMDQGQITPATSMQGGMAPVSPQDGQQGMGQIGGGTLPQGGAEGPSKSIFKGGKIDIMDILRTVSDGYDMANGQAPTFAGRKAAQKSAAISQSFMQNPQAAIQAAYQSGDSKLGDALRDTYFEQNNINTDNEDNRSRIMDQRLDRAEKGAAAMFGSVMDGDPKTFDRVSAQVQAYFKKQGLDTDLLPRDIEEARDYSRRIYDFGQERDDIRSDANTDSSIDTREAQVAQGWSRLSEQERSNRARESISRSKGSGGSGGAKSDKPVGTTPRPRFAGDSISTGSGARKRTLTSKDGKNWDY
jgi:hypothetical protein